MRFSSCRAAVRAAVILSCCAGPALAGRSDPRWHTTAVWREPEGLPQESVRTILQTRDGYVWIGTRAGLARFDGVRFANFDDRDKAGLPENEVWDLAEGPDGLWIGVYGGGVSRLKDGRFTTYSKKDGLADDFVRVLALDRTGALWVGTDGGLSRLRDGRFTNFTVKDGLGAGLVRALLAEPDGSVLVATEGRLQRVTDGRIEPFVLPGPATLGAGTVDALRRDRRGALWIGTSSGLVRVAGGTSTRYTTDDGLSANGVRKLYEDLEGRVWVATSGGLDRHSAGSGRFVNESVSSDLIALHGDREGGVFVGHRGGGLERLHLGIFSTYGAPAGLPAPDVTTVLHARDGTTWAGSLHGLSVLQAGRFTTLGGQHGLPGVGTIVSALAEDRTGRLWVGTTDGLYRSLQPPRCTERGCDVRFARLGGAAALATRARVILEDRSGAVWIGTDVSGLVRWVDGRLSVFTSENGLPHDGIRALAQTRDGSLWIGTKGRGLARYKDGAFQTFSERDGLPGHSVQALHVDRDDALWVATRRGVSRYRDGRFANFSVENGLYWNHVYAFLEDDLGRLWMSCGRGVFRVDKAQLDAVAEGRASAVSSVAYGRAHGLPSTMAAVGAFPSAARSADGRIWFAILGGLAVADPRHLLTNPVAPPVQVEQVLLDGRPLGADGATAPPGRGDFTFHYTALSYEAPQGVRFMYRLEGFDHDWVDAGARRVAYYTNMPPGRYRFHAIARNSDGVWNEQGAAVSFALAPHFYETRWFYAALAVALLLAGAGSQRLRVLRSQARERLLAARVDAVLAEMKVLSGLLPVCASCKRINDEKKGRWSQMEQYIHEHSEADFSHGICPDCAERLYPGVAARPVAEPPST